MNLYEYQRYAKEIEPVGSRVTCLPEPTGRDYDYLVLTKRMRHWGLHNRLTRDGFILESNAHYRLTTGFRSYRRMNVIGVEYNLIVTKSRKFFDKFMMATAVCKGLNLQEKHERVLVFQAILYGNSPHGLRKKNLAATPDV